MRDPEDDGFDKALEAMKNNPEADFRRIEVPLEPRGHDFGENNKAEVLMVGGKPFVQCLDFPCRMCGKGQLLELTEEGARTKEPCSYPHGVQTVITLKVPSGKIIVTDDLRPIYDGFDHDRFASYNCKLGQAEVIWAFAEIGCAFGPVGNSCPGLYRISDAPGRYIIASPEYDEDDKPSLPEDNLMASICTDLWAYSIADFEDWKARGGDPETLGWSTTIVDVEPGTYEFTHHTGERGFDQWAKGTIVFAHIQKID